MNHALPTTPVAVRFDPEGLRAALNDDPEFALRARHLNASFQIRTGDQVMDARVIDGVVVELREDDTGFVSFDILLEGEAEVWREILAAVPRPFYQDFWSAMFHHGFRIAGNLDLLSAYYSAVRRACDVMRAQWQEGLAR